MTTVAKMQVSNELEDELDYLMGKKQREILKKQKLREMEQ